MRFTGKLLFTVITILSTTMIEAKENNLNQLTDSSTGVFEIGRVIVKGNKSSTGKLTNVVTAEQLNKNSINDVPHAVNKLPGVTMTALGARNETGVSVRGFDLRQVPLYIDGIPVYVPYDGYVDLGRFSTSDIAEIRVDKGYSSILYGPNALGGAINLVSRKPLFTLEMKGKFGLKGSISPASNTTWLPQNDGSLMNISIGSRLNKKFYIAAGVSGLNARNYLLSKDFTPTKYQTDRIRQNSYHRDVKVNVKIGYMPSELDEYALSYSYQHGKKGVPLYAGTNQKQQHDIGSGLIGIVKASILIREFHWDRTGILKCRFTMTNLRIVFTVMTALITRLLRKDTHSRAGMMTIQLDHP